MRMKWIGEKIENMAAHYSMARLAENGRKIIINSFCNSLQIYTSENPSAREYGNLENKYANCIEEDKEGSRRHRCVSQTLRRRITGRRGTSGRKNRMQINFLFK